MTRRVLAPRRPVLIRLAARRRKDVALCVESAPRLLPTIAAMDFIVALLTDGDEVVRVHADARIPDVHRREFPDVVHDLRVRCTAHFAHVEIPCENKRTNLFPLERIVEGFTEIFCHAVSL